MTAARLALRSRGFAAFLVTQFLGAFNDNAYKFTLIYLLADHAVDEGREGLLWMAAQGLFALPFIVFAARAGALADRHGKHRIIRWAKVAEIAVMSAGWVAFGTGRIAPLYAVLFLMSVQSTFFGPGKYGYLAEKMAETDLSRANGLVNMTTMMAAVTGMIAGGVIYEAHRGDLASGAIWFVAFAVLGTAASLGVPPAEASRPGRTGVASLTDLRATWRGVRGNVTLLYTMGGIGHFFLLAALMQVQLVDYGESWLGLSETGAGVLMSTVVVGIAAGSLLAARWSEGRVELGLVPLGATAMSAGIVLLALCDRPERPAAQMIAEGAGARDLLSAVGIPFGLGFAIGAAGGLFIVPLNALLQHTAPAHEKGRYTAFGNLVSFVGIMLSGVFLWLPRELGLSLPTQFLCIALLSLVGTTISVRVLPYAFVRLLGWLLAHTFYRIRVLHAERIPDEGGAVLLVNHVSWVDALILGATTRRGLHFLIYRQYYEWWPARWLFRLVGCIPVASGDAPAVVQASLDTAGRYLDEGKLVVVFAEGAVTRLGHMLPFRSGYQRILGDRDVPIVPVHLDGLWGSIFSHSGGRLVFKVPRAIPYPVTVSIGEPLPSSSPPHLVRSVIRRLSAEAWEERRRTRRPLPVSLLIEMRREFGPIVHEHGRHRGLSPARVAARASLLARRLERHLAGAGRVGVVARPGLDATVAILALQVAGRIPVPLDESEGPASWRRLLGRAQVGAVLASAAAAAAWRAEAQDGPGEPTVLVLPDLLRDLAARAERWRVAWHALLPGRLVPRLVAEGARHDMDALAVIVFSRNGRVGAPQRRRPVCLSHANVLGNVEGLREVIDFERRDAVLGVLPLSSSFGLVTTLWLPLLSGLGVSWHPDVGHGRSVGKLVERRRLTILPASPTILAALTADARPDNLGGLRLVLSGLEPLDPDTRESFARRFGITPLEVYTCTECTAVVALNTPNVRRVGVYQRGNLHGTVGHPLPGVAVEIIDPSNGDALPYGRAGLIAIHGPGIMRGYWDGGAPRGAPGGGALVTGDRGVMDEEGFLTLLV